MTKSVFTTEYRIFLKLLIEERKRAGLTQTLLAQKLEQSQPYVAKYEKGVRRLDLIEFLEIADAIGCNPFDFLSKLFKRFQ